MTKSMVAALRTVASRELSSSMSVCPGNVKTCHPANRAALEKTGLTARRKCHETTPGGHTSFRCIASRTSSPSRALAYIVDVDNGADPRMIPGMAQFYIGTAARVWPQTYYGEIAISRFVDV